jgi:hypothetical protein
MTTISNSTTLGITLSFPTYVNPIVIDPSVTISNSGNAVYASTGSWTIQNDGTISSPTAVGVYLIPGGSVTNAASASIMGGKDGVAFKAATSPVQVGLRCE